MLIVIASVLTAYLILTTRQALSEVFYMVEILYNLTQTRYGGVIIILFLMGRKLQGRAGIQIQVGPFQSWFQVPSKPSQSPASPCRRSEMFAEWICAYMCEERGE